MGHSVEDFFEALKKESDAGKSLPNWCGALDFCLAAGVDSSDFICWVLSQAWGTVPRGMCFEQGGGNLVVLTVFRLACRVVPSGNVHFAWCVLMRLILSCGILSNGIS